MHYPVKMFSMLAYVACESSIEHSIADKTCKHWAPSNTERYLNHRWGVWSCSPCNSHTALFLLPFFILLLFLFLPFLLADEELSSLNTHPKGTMFRPRAINVHHQMFIFIFKLYIHRGKFSKSNYALTFEQNKYRLLPYASCLLMCEVLSVLCSAKEGLVEDKKKKEKPERVSVGQLVSSAVQR